MDSYAPVKCCGRKPTLIGGDYYDPAKVRCDNCRKETRRSSIEDAIEDWNNGIYSRKEDSR